MKTVLKTPCIPWKCWVVRYISKYRNLKLADSECREFEDLQFSKFECWFFNFIRIKIKNEKENPSSFLQETVTSHYQVL